MLSPSGLDVPEQGVFPIARADRLKNTGTALWSGTPTAAMFVIAGETGVAVSTEQTNDGGLRIFTATPDKYIDVTLTLPMPVVAKTAAIEIRNPSTTASISLYLSKNSGFAAADYISRFFGVNNLGTSETHRHGGRKWLLATGTSSLPWTNTGALDLDKTLFTHMRLRVAPSAGQVADFTLFSARANVVGRSRIAVVSDDGYSSWLKYAVPVFQRRGIPTSLAIIPAMVGFNSNYATWDQLREFVAAGNECLPHGPSAGNNLFDHPTLDARVNDVISTGQRLVAEGVAGPQQLKCYIFPEGKFAANHDDMTLLDALHARGITFGRTVTRSFGFPADLLATSKYSALTTPILGYIRQSTEANDIIEQNNTLNSIETCGRDGLDGIVMAHNIIADQGTWTWTQSIDMTIGFANTLADKLVDVRKNYGAEIVLVSSFAP